VIPAPTNGFCHPDSGMKAIFDALNVVYNVDERRSFMKLNGISLAFTLSAILSCSPL